MPRRTGARKTNQPQPATEAAGPAFQRLAAELAAERELSAEHTALQAQAAELRAELARLETRLARAEQATERCGELGRELEQLGPRLGYNFDLPQDASLAIIGQLGLLRVRAAGACRRLRAAVGSAQHLGAFKHRVLAVCAGGFLDEVGHTVVCTGDAVFSFGNGNQGQLGYDADEYEFFGRMQRTPRVVTGLLDQEVVAAAASVASTLVCTAQGQAYCFGQLASLRGLSMPQLVGGLQQVVGVAAGDHHLLAWTRAGQLYTWGNGNNGRLGHGDTDGKAAPRLVEGLAGQQVVRGDGSRYTSVVCTASGRVYTFGTGRAKLGHGPDASNAQLTPRLVEALVSSMVVAVGTGHDFTAVVTEAGELYTWGGSDYGALGHDEESMVEFLPRLVAGLAGKRVAGFATGNDHTLAWTDSGELYSWGCGDHGQLGHISREDEWSPRQVEALAGRVVVGAAAGFEHSVVVTREQKVYRFGLEFDREAGEDYHMGTPEPKEVGGLRVGVKIAEPVADRATVAWVYTRPAHVYKFCFSAGSSRAGHVEWAGAHVQEISRLGGEVCDLDSSSLDFDATHLVVKAPFKRTTKVISACARGLHIVAESFIEASAAAGCFIDEKPHRVQISNGKGRLWDGAAQRWKDLSDFERRKPLDAVRVLLVHPGGSENQLVSGILATAGACRVEQMSELAELPDDAEAPDGAEAFVCFSDTGKGTGRAREIVEQASAAGVPVVRFVYFVDRLCLKEAPDSQDCNYLVGVNDLG